MSAAVEWKGTKRAPRSAIKSRMETRLITPDDIKKWQIPDFQRPLKLNTKVMALAELLGKPEKEGGFAGIIPGIITLGVLKGGWYIVDGQHRMKAFEISGIAEAIVDLRIMDFDNAADMADEFATLNSNLVTMTPDDRLRALEKGVDALKTIRGACRFVGYGRVRQKANAATTPLISMSSALRAWGASAMESASFSGTGSIIDYAREITKEEAEGMAQFLNACYEAWGNPPEYWGLWNSLNITLLAWVWRRMVIAPPKNTSKITRLTIEQFVTCAMTLSADKAYLDFLYGRKGETDRSPCYFRIKQNFAKRLATMGVVKPYFPNAEWVSSGGRVRPV